MTGKPKGGKLRGRFPLTTTLPALISIAMFLVAVGTTQVGVWLVRMNVEDAHRAKIEVFLDAIAGGFAAELEADPESVQNQLVKALAYKTSLREEALAVRWTAQDGSQQTVIVGDQYTGDLTTALDQASGSSLGSTSFSIDPGRAFSSVTRTYGYGQEDQHFIISALFDARDVFDTEQLASNWALAIDVTVALVAALATFFITRRAMSPLNAFVLRLAEADGDQTRKLDRGDELRRLELALAMREQSEAERSRALSLLAEHERDALLARLAAGIAHEVRNPLAGLLNGLSTLRRFGDNTEVRERTIGILEDGFRSIERVVDVTLSTYRRRSGLRRLTGREIRDLDLLISQEAKQANVDVAWNVPDEIAMHVDADSLRQALLNLLINAIRATPPYGTVTVTVTVAARQDELVVEVADTGQGMPADIVASLVSGDIRTLPDERGLGIWMISNFVERLNAKLMVDSSEESGTTVKIILPYSHEEQAARIEE